jgi:formate dehydrogenase subunit delta
MEADRLVYMANQIGKFFASEDPKTAVAMTADHLKKFWDPRMRREIVAYVEGGGRGLDGTVHQAVLMLRLPGAEPHGDPPRDH